MALYQQHGANPLAGCLPTLVQLPVFIVLYRVINGLTKIGGDGVPNPAYLDKDSALYQDLVDDGGEGHHVEDVLELLPHLDVVSPLALVVEAVDAGDRCTLVVATELEEVLREFDLVGKHQRDCL